MSLNNSFSLKQFSLEQITRFIFLGSIVLATIIAFVPSFSVTFLSTKVIVIVLGSIIAFACYVFVRFNRGYITIPPLLLIGAAWLIPFAYGLSTIFSGAPISFSVFGHAFETDTFGFIFLMGLVVTLAAFLIEFTSQYRNILRVSAWLAAFIFAAQAIFIIIHYVVPTLISSSFTLFGSWSDLGIFSGLVAIIILFAFRFIPLSTRIKYALSILLAVAFLYIALAHSSVTWIAVGIIALGLFVESVIRRISLPTMSSDTTFNVHTDSDTNDTIVNIETQETVWDTDDHQYNITAPFIVLALSVFFIVGGSTFSGVLGNAMHISTANIRPSWQSTINIGRDTYKTSAVFGSGPNTFGQQWLLYRNKSLNTTPFWSIDFSNGIGFIPTSFITTGIIGIIAWLLFLGVFIWMGIRSFLLREYKNTSIYAVSLISYIGALFIFFEMLFAVPGPMLIIFGFLFVGMFVSTLRYVETQQQSVVSFTENPRVGFITIFTLILFMFLLIISAYLMVDRYISQIYLANAQEELSTGNITDANTSTVHSLQFDRTSDAYQLRAIIAAVGIRNFLRNASSTTSVSSQKYVQSVLSQGITSAQAAIRINPNMYLNWMALGNLYQIVAPLGVSGAYDAAQKAYQKAQTLNPISPIIPYVRAQAAITNKSYTEAETLLEKAITLKPNYTGAIFTLSRVEVQLGKAKKALHAAESAMYFAPQNKFILFQVGVLRQATGDNIGAIAALSNAVRIDPKYANAHYFLAVAYANEKEYAKSVIELKKIETLSSKYIKTINPFISTLEQNRNPFLKSFSNTKTLQKGSLGK